MTFENEKTSLSQHKNRIEAFDIAKGIDMLCIIADKTKEAEN